MRVYRLAWLAPNGWMLASIALLAGCGGSNDPPPTPATSDAGQYVEPDGDIAIDTLCPPADHPRVHYQEHDPTKCMNVIIECTTDQNGFQGRCGCGCIDKGEPICPAVTDMTISWKSHDPAQCGSEAPVCPLGQIAFNNTCGCGCADH